MTKTDIPADAERPNLLHGLAAKRVEIAQDMEVAQAALAKLAADLIAVETTILVFEPGFEFTPVKVRMPTPQHVAWKGEVTRSVFDTLRGADRPMTAREIALAMMEQRGLERHDKKLAVLMSKRVRNCLLAKKARGLIRSVEVAGGMLGWELVR